MGQSCARTLGLGLCFVLGACNSILGNEPGVLVSVGGASDGGLDATADGSTTGCKSCETEHATCGPISDGCGHTLDCGVCPRGQICDAGRCANQPYCGNGLCDIAETCETCPADCGCNGHACLRGACCVPSCTGKTCGDDGCGGSCAPGCNKGFLCDGGQCVDMPSCGNGSCEPTLKEDCSSCPFDCVCSTGRRCLASTCCDPAATCTGKQCGSDGCGGTCGPCGPGASCLDGRCKGDVFCGNGACEPGETCSNCPADCGCAAGQTCTVSGSCCTPQCSGKDCGSDGCGGACPSTCGADLSCGSDFKCHTSGPLSVVGGIVIVAPSTGAMRLARPSLSSIDAWTCGGSLCVRGGLSK
jgi:hypothetical protein